MYLETDFSHYIGINRHKNNTLTILGILRFFFDCEKLKSKTVF